MLSLRELQESFLESLFEWHHAAHCGVEVAQSACIAVYQNNVFENLRRALADVYPVVARLVGEAFFRQTATRYIRLRPSKDANLEQYGDGFADFLAELPQLRVLPYLPDTARLEWLIHESFHAAEAEQRCTERLRRIAPEEYASVRFELHPACRLLTSPYPIHRIWQVNQPGYEGDDRVDLSRGGVNLLLRRRNYVVELEEIAATDFAMFKQFAAGETFSRAYEAVQELHLDFDVRAFLERCVLSNTLVDCHLINGPFHGENDASHTCN